MPNPYETLPTSSFSRPRIADVNMLEISNRWKAKEEPYCVTSITVHEMCTKMVAEDLTKAKRHVLFKEYGCKLPMHKE